MDCESVETPHPLHDVRAKRGILRHSVSRTSHADTHGAIRGHTDGTSTTGATRDEEQGKQRSEFSRGPVGAWQNSTEGQPGNTVEEGAERLRSYPERDPEGRQRCNVPRTTRNVREPVAADPPGYCGTRSRGDSEQSHRACVCRETTCRDRTPLLSSWTREHDDAGHAAAESFFGNVQRAVQLQDSVWTDAMFDWCTG